MTTSSGDASFTSDPGAARSSTHRGLDDVELALSCGDQVIHVLWAQLRDQVDVERRSHLTVDGGRHGPAHAISNAEALENPGEDQCEFDRIGRRGMALAQPGHRQLTCGTRGRGEHLGLAPGR